MGVGVFGCLDTSIEWGFSMVYSILISEKVNKRNPQSLKYWFKKMHSILCYKCNTFSSRFKIKCLRGFLVFLRNHSKILNWSKLNKWERWMSSAVGIRNSDTSTQGNLRTNQFISGIFLLSLSETFAFSLPKPAPAKVDPCRQYLALSNCLIILLSFKNSARWQTSFLYIWGIH